jgi:antitoxin component of MazEF toxin-antitoxin module
MQRMSKEAAVMKFFFDGVKVHKLGNSTAIIVPAMWVKLNTLKINGTRYAKVHADGSKIIIEPMNDDPEKIKETLERNDVKPVEIS